MAEDLDRMRLKSCVIYKYRTPLIWVVPLSLFEAAFFLAPFLFIFALAVKEGPIWREQAAVSYKNFEMLLSSPFPQALLNSILLGVACAITASFVALSLVLVTWHFFRERQREYFLKGVMLVFFAGLIARIYAMQFLFSGEVLGAVPLASDLGFAGGILYSISGIVLGLVSILLPLDVAILYAARKDVPLELEWAARDLGASHLQTLRKVVVPLMGHGILVASMLGFVLSLADVVVVDLIGGGALYTVSLTIIDFFKIDDWNLAAAASVIVFCVEIPALAVLSASVLKWIGR